jgi:hypothetical protein
MPKMGFISASMARGVMSRGRGKDEYGETFKTLALSVAAGRIGWDVSTDISGLSAVEWGVENEWLAIRTYEEMELVEVVGSDFIVWDGKFGCTPDGIVGLNGIIEVKCPLSTNHLGNLIENKQLDDYYPQMQFELWGMNREWCDWISFDPRAPEQLQMHVLRVNRDEEYIKTLSARAIACAELVDEYETTLRKRMES